jgi:hypothetical protein
MRVFTNTSAAYLYALEEILYYYDYKSSPRGLPIFEKLDYSFRVTEPTSDSIVTKDEERNKVIAAYTEKEKALYDSCSNNVEDFGKASKFWLKLANPDNTINSAYGYLIWANKSHGNAFEQEAYTMSEDSTSGGKILGQRTKMRTPWEWARESLIADKDSRQAILRFSLPTHQWVGNKDQTCTLHGNFLIRNDKLHLSVTMRSNDLVKGLVYDLPWFCSLMDKMLEELKPYYPNLIKGHYTHIVHSLHMYQKDEEIVRKMIGHGN